MVNLLKELLFLLLPQLLVLDPHLLVVNASLALHVNRVVLDHDVLEERLLVHGASLTVAHQVIRLRFAHFLRHLLGWLRHSISGHGRGRSLTQSSPQFGFVGLSHLQTTGYPCLRLVDLGSGQQLGRH